MQTGTQRGATWGGLTGAIAGAIIGENNDEAGAGAAIGGVVGALAGGVIGNANDKDARARAGYYNQRTYAAPTQVYAAPQPTYAPVHVAAPAPVQYVSGAVSMADVVALTRSGVGPSVVINQINTRGVVRTPDVSDILSLHQSGVPEIVITAMQHAPVGSGGPVVVSTPPVVVVDDRPRHYHHGGVYRARPHYYGPYGH